MTRVNDKPVSDANPLPTRQQSSNEHTLTVPMARGTGVSVELAVTAVRDTYDITVGAGEGATVDDGDLIEMFNTITFMQAIVLSHPSADVLRLDTLVNHAYPSGSPVNVSTINMAVDGSITPQVFAIKPEPGQRGRFNRIILAMVGTVAMDTGTFGPLGALTRGLLLRVKQADGDYRNLYTVKTNAGFKAVSFDGDFDPNNGQGQRMFTTRLSWGGEDKHGAIIEIDGSGLEADDIEIQMVVQDNLDDATFLALTAVAEGREF